MEAGDGRGEGRRRGRSVLAALAFLAAWLGAAAAGEQAAVVRLSIVGGLASVTQFSKFEQPFWEEEITERSGGRIVATIRPFDGGALRGQEMLQLIRLGVVPFGTLLLSIVSADEPELDAADLPLLNPDMAALRNTVGHERDYMKALLLERYGIVMLGIYAYPAQVLYCREPFTGLDDLAGRKVRTSSVGQSDLMSALGAVPVIVPFAEIVGAIGSGVADCAITGTLSGFEIGLPAVTSHVHRMALGWGLSVFGANRDAWEALDPDIRDIIREGIADLEARIWAQADMDTERGLACDTGGPACTDANPGKMTLVDSAADEPHRRRLLQEVVLPRWIARCGEGCAEAWNAHLAAATGIGIGPE